MAPDDNSGARPAGPVVLRIKLRYDDIDAMVQRFAPNVGKSGLFLPTKSIQPIGTEVKFELRLANDTPVLVGMGRVKHVKPPDPKHPRAAFGMAIELMRVSREGREVIIRMIERRRAMGLPDVAIPVPEDIDAARREGDSQPRAESSGVVREAMSQFASAPVAEQVLTGSPTQSGPVAIAKETSAPAERPSAPLMTSPRPSRSTAEHKAVVALAPEPARAKRPRVADLIAKASELSGPLAAAPVPELDEQVDVQRALSRARALATGDLDAELAAVRELAAAPIEIGIEAASAELARQLGGKAIVKRDRSAGWAPPPAIETRLPVEDLATSPSNESVAEPASTSDGETSASDGELATSTSDGEPRASASDGDVANESLAERAASTSTELSASQTANAEFAAKTRAETEIAPSAVIAQVTTAAVHESAPAVEEPTPLVAHESAPAIEEPTPIEAPLLTDDAPISMRAPSSEPIDEANVLESVPLDRVEPSVLEPEMIDRDAHLREGYERDASQPSAEAAALAATALAAGTDEEEPMELDDADLELEDDQAAAEYEQDQRTRVPSGDESYNLYSRLSPESAEEVMREFDRGPAVDEDAAREFDRDLRTRVPSGDEDYRAASPVAHMMISDDADVAEFERALDDAPEHLNSNEIELAESTQIGEMPVDPNVHGYPNAHAYPTTPDSLAEQLDQQLAEAEAEAEADLQLGMQQQPYDTYGQPIDRAAYRHAVEHAAYGQAVDPAAYGQGAEQGSYGQPGDPAGYGQAVEQAAYGRDGYEQGAYEQGGYEQGAYEQGGYQEGGHQERGHQERGHQERGYQQGGYEQGAYEQGGYEEGSQAGEDEGEEISDLDVLAEADEDDADLLGASGEQDSLDRAPAYAEPPYQTPEYEKQDPDAIAPQDRPSFDFANALDLGDDSAQHALDDLHGSHAPMRPKRRSSAGDFDAPSNSYTFAESFPQAQGPSLDEALGSALDEDDAADEFDEPHSYAQRQPQPQHQAPAQPQRPAPAQPQRQAPAHPQRQAPSPSERHMSAQQKRPISEPQYLRNPDDLEDALAALDVDLDDISLDQQRSRRAPAPSQRSSSTSPRPLPGLPIHRPSEHSRPHTVPRTPTGQQPAIRPPTGQQPALRPPNARDLEDPPSTQYVLKRPATGHDTLLPTKKAIKPAPAPKRASTDDGIIIDFDDDIDE